MNLDSYEFEKEEYYLIYTDLKSLSIKANYSILRPCYTYLDEEIFNADRAINYKDKKANVKFYIPPDTLDNSHPLTFEKNYIGSEYELENKFIYSKKTGFNKPMVFKFECQNATNAERLICFPGKDIDYWRLANKNSAIHNKKSMNLYPWDSLQETATLFKKLKHPYAKYQKQKESEKQILQEIEMWANAKSNEISKQEEKTFEELYLLDLYENPMKSKDEFTELKSWKHNDSTLLKTFTTYNDLENYYSNLKSLAKETLEKPTEMTNVAWDHFIQYVQKNKQNIIMKLELLKYKELQIQILITLRRLKTQDPASYFDLIRKEFALPLSIHFAIHVPDWFIAHLELLPDNIKGPAYDIFGFQRSLFMSPVKPTIARQWTRRETPKKVLKQRKASSRAMFRTSTIDLQPIRSSLDKNESIDIQTLEEITSNSYPFSPFRNIPASPCVKETPISRRTLKNINLGTPKDNIINSDNLVITETPLKDGEPAIPFSTLPMKRLFS
ncbi:hypothetical protein O9G_004249 [Rozella allomycis CSF55]|uniref:Uncharacterized protein n=1 Tax=Rozella allomycis (strain CSF55) TaxID=988480 RepID=A0A075APC2_ROZAC|nr:hypothetical protein O9G_004249 [Rozella allomycis CSF55]|eukprot:EPZ31858.1 hypothetical protein O9G_004249 [Rozella allomycis CSF55]